MLTTKFASKYVRIDDVNIHYVAAGPSSSASTDTTPLLFLHGFPEYWQTWQSQFDYFAINHHVIAPDLPGYNLSDKPQALGFYQIPRLIEFFVKFIQAVSPGKKVFLIAHDWGGVIAWPLAAFYPQYIEKLIILNAAHPSTFTREMINNPAQRHKSDYIQQLISTQAIALLTKNNYQSLCDKMLMALNPNAFNHATKSNYLKAWQQPGAINGMLQYYRAMPQLADTDTNNNETNVTTQVTNLAKMNVPNIRVNVPTLILWGENDQAFVNENLAGIEEYVPDCKIKRFKDASHWLTHEKSPEINQAIKGFIRH